jgi:hypothetical protein
MADDVAKLAPVGISDAVLGGKIAEVAARISGTVDSDMKAILAGVLRAGEKTLTEMDALKLRLEAAEMATKEAAEASVKKIKRSNLVAAARAAGAVDATEALQFIKLGDVTVNEAGESNATELVATLRAAKPHLFAKSSTSAAAAAPAATDAVKKSVLAMTKEEYAAAKAAVIRR